MDRAEIPSLAMRAAAGSGSTGSAATSATQRLPLSIRRYVRANIAAGATAGDNTAKKATLALAY